MLEFGVVGGDRLGAHVGVGDLLESCADLLERVRAGYQRQPLVEARRGVTHRAECCSPVGENESFRDQSGGGSRAFPAE